ncbi:MAG TPA: hypothetical protein DDW85_01565 [Porphyromonadaceae bacterium]|nr:hypothetical protein [Porphyromonadaceae bacterium]
MITTEEIGLRVREVLLAAKIDKEVAGGVDFYRTDYTKEGVIIVPHSITGEGSVRFGQIKINIHVPDITRSNPKSENPAYVPYLKRLIEIRSKVIETLKNHFEIGKGYNWNIGMISPPIKEEEQNEHFVSISLDITVRNN